MQMEDKPKNSRNSPKKKLVVKSLETGVISISKPGGVEPGKILREIIATIPALTAVSSEEKHQLIAEAAYLRAEQRSFAPGYELEDWLSAEAEIETKLSEISSPIRSQSNVDTRSRRR